MRRRIRGNLVAASTLVFGILLFTLFGLMLSMTFQFQHPLSRGKWWVILCSSIVLIIIALLLFWWCIYRPLKKLEDALKCLESVNGGENRNFWGNAEMMAENINILLDELTQSLEREHTEAMLRQQFQYAELQNQINPHFLYNTLETIRGQAVIDDNYKIADMTETLAKYFRYNISKNNDDVTLEQELENIQNYIKIHQYRFQERFQFRIVSHVEREEYRYCMIPKMTLQPIVENAIFHGVEQKLEPGNILIHIETTMDKLIIIVADDGVGISPEKLERINQKLRMGAHNIDMASGEKHNGIAMQNVNSRLHMLYGEMYGLTVTSTLGLGTEVEITLPKLHAREKEELL